MGAECRGAKTPNPGIDPINPTLHCSVETFSLTGFNGFRAQVGPSRSFWCLIGAELCPEIQVSISCRVCSGSRVSESKSKAR